jgi:transposase-like protein
MKKTGRVNNKYSPEFKKEAVEKYLSGKYGGYTIFSRELNLKSPTQLKNWVKLYRQDPELPNTDGRALGIKDGVKKGRPMKVDLDELDKDEQIEYLKMENAILKKAKALRQSYGEH